MSKRRGRGVFTCPFCSPGGYETLIAVDGRERIVGKFTVTNPEARARLITLLWKAITLMEATPPIHLIQ